MSIPRFVQHGHGATVFPFPFLSGIVPYEKEQMGFLTRLGYGRMGGAVMSACRVEPPPAVEINEITWSTADLAGSILFETGDISTFHYTRPSMQASDTQ